MPSPSAKPHERDHCFVVPAYGDSPFLAGCLASLRAQTLQSRIVVATSTPSPFIEAEARKAGAELMINPQRQGIAADWNYALRATEARFVTLAHQDDLYRPDFLARSLAGWKGRAEAALCFTGYQEIDDDGRPVSSKISKAKHLIERVTLGRAAVVRGARLRAYLSFGNPLPCSSVTFDLSRLAGFSFSGGFDSNLDWDAWRRLQHQGETFLRVPERLVGRRHNPLTETSRLIQNGRRQAEDRLMFRQLWPRPLGDLIACLYRAGY